MKKLITFFVLAVGILCGCTKEETGNLFTAKEAEACLTQSDHEVIDRACAKVRAYDAAKKADAMTEAIEIAYGEAIEELRDLMGKIDEEGDSPWYNEQGTLIVGLNDFLSDESILERTPASIRKATSATSNYKKGGVK